MVNREMFFSFGEHAVQGFVSAERVLETNIQILTQKYPDKRIILAIETPFITSYQAKYIEEQVNVRGYRPADALLYASTPGADLNKPPAHKDFTDEAWMKKFKGLSEVAQFYYGQAEMINQLFDKYPIRLYLMTEMGTESQVEDYEKDVERKNKLMTQQLLLAQSGQFDEATRKFKQGTILALNRSIDRETRFKERLKAYIAKEEVAGIVVRFGAGHSSMMYDLKQEGFEVGHEFDTFEGKTRLYIPPDVGMERLIRFRGLKNISDDQWLKGMLGDLFYRITKLNLEGSRESVRNNAYTRAVSEVLKNHFPDTESIRAFEEMIKQVGFQEAFVEIYSTILRLAAYRKGREDVE